MERWIWITFLQLGFSTMGWSQEVLTIQVLPEQVWIETGEYAQHLNMDFILSNLSDDTLTLEKIKVMVRDESGRLLLTRFLDGNGTAPGIHTIPDRELGPHEVKLYFNPFSDFDPGLSLARLEFEWTFIGPIDTKYEIKCLVEPTLYHQPIKFSFPLKGIIQVYDGHDLLSHHRRFDYQMSFMQELGLTANFMRYAYDFVVLNTDYQAFTGNAEEDKSYVGFGQPVYGVADGTVIYASNQHPDDKTFDIPGIANNAMELFGNCIAIEHARGLISIYGHLMHNSITVTTGEKVKSGQQLAQMGVSGSSFFPHLHFEIRTSITGAAEGLPSYFSSLKILNGTQRIKMKSGLPETGAIYYNK